MNVSQIDGIGLLIELQYAIGVIAASERAIPHRISRLSTDRFVNCAAVLSQPSKQSIWRALRPQMSRAWRLSLDTSEGDRRKGEAKGSRRGGA
jgi:hypothetical protein